MDTKRTSEPDQRLLDTLAQGYTVVCYGNAQPGDVHLMSRVVAVNDEIVAWLARSERRRRKARPSPSADPP